MPEVTTIKHKPLVLGEFAANFMCTCSDPSHVRPATWLQFVISAQNPVLFKKYLSLYYNLGY